MKKLTFSLIAIVSAILFTFTFFVMIDIADGRHAGLSRSPFFTLSTNLYRFLVVIFCCLGFFVLSLVAGNVAFIDLPKKMIISLSRVNFNMTVGVEQLYSRHGHPIAKAVRREYPSWKVSMIHGNIICMKNRNKTRYYMLDQDYERSHFSIDIDQIPHKKEIRTVHMTRITQIEKLIPA